MSTSSGKVWIKLLLVPVTLVIKPVCPATVMFDGYGVAAPDALIVIGDGLQGLEVLQIPVTVTVKLQLDPDCDEQVTVEVPMGKNDPEGGEQLTVPQVPLVVGAG